MPNIRQNLASLLEYFGLESRNYYHSVPEVIHDRSDKLAYYLDFRDRAAYPGPFDPSGLPLVEGPGGVMPFPTHLSMYALANLELYRHNKLEAHLDRARICAEWLAANQQPDGAWLSPFAKKEFGLKPPFRSAMIQGLGISALCRVGAALGETRYHEAAVRALGPFGRDVTDDGVTTSHDVGPFFEEYPCRPACHVLNGCIYALWGLHDLMKRTDCLPLRDVGRPGPTSSDAGETVRQGRLTAQDLWNAGVKTLAAWLPRYDIGYWSLYHLPESPRNPATVAYHRLHINQLSVMHALTSIPVFKEYEDRWRGYLSHRTNALHTLPAKLRWVMTSRSGLQH